MSLLQEKAIDLPGFKYPKCKVRQLTIGQQRKFPESDKDVYAPVRYVVEHALVNDQGDPVITDNYTIDDFENECPASFYETIANAFADLNDRSDKAELEAAKNS